MVIKAHPLVCLESGLGDNSVEVEVRRQRESGSLDRSRQSFGKVCWVTNHGHSFVRLPLATKYTRPHAVHVCRRHLSH
ncbi:hypothetical protein PsYK624_063160 [Phanerochaete sordida]|uniref:Uncharacterized protein n=1 Tax=Phanerochaete sordida TaxID=48140 RepID=A0A9P3LCF5_9APHY|nr:hypothetical protein PsYK624_063160 [Phanerochaete sordida]